MKQGEQLAAVAGSVKGEMIISKPAKGGWLITALLFFSLSAEDCVGCQGGQARAVAHLPAFPVCLLTFSSPDSAQPKAGQLGPQPHLHPIMSGETLDIPSLLPVLKAGKSVPTSWGEERGRGSPWL